MCIFFYSQYNGTSRIKISICPYHFDNQHLHCPHIQWNSQQFPPNEKKQQPHLCVIFKLTQAKWFDRAQICIMGFFFSDVRLTYKQLQKHTNIISIFCIFIKWNIFSSLTGRQSVHWNTTYSTRTDRMWTIV